MEEVDFGLIDESSFIELSRNHKNSALVCVGLKYYDTPEKISDIFLSGLHVSALAYSKLVTVMDTVRDLFNENKIRHIIVKGPAIAKYYPAPELRVMDDVDFVLDVKDKKYAEALFSQYGAILDFGGSDQFNTSWKINSRNIELHYRLGYHAHLNSQYDYEAYFESVWNNIKKIENETYELSFSYSFIYSIFHLAKHFYKSGCGVRMITDIAVMVKNADHKTDWNHIFDELKTIGLKEFAIRILYICKEWFAISLPDIGVDWDMYQCPPEIYDYILNAGVFGFSNVSRDVSSIRTSSEHGYVRGFLKWAFPSYHHMRAYSPWYKNKPAVVLPAAYIERIYRNAKERGGMINWMKSIKKGKSSNDNHEKILKIMELR